MVDVAAFRGLRYDPAVAGDPVSTSAPAYDELERFAYAHHRTASPYTVLELLNPKHGAATYARWRRTGVLVSDPEPAFYRYEEHELRGRTPAVQRGLLVAVSVDDDAVLLHEDVDPPRVHVRAERLRTVPVDLAPIFALAVGLPAPLRRLLTAPPTAPPVVALTDEDGVDHRVWRLDDPQVHDLVRRQLREVTLFLADGHHRWAAARAVHAAEPGWEQAGRTLCWVVDTEHDGPRLLPVHRLVQELPARAVQRLERDFAIVPVLPPTTDRVRDAVDPPRRELALVDALRGQPAGVLGLLLPDRALLLRPRELDRLRAGLPAGTSPRWRSLDTALLEHAVFPALGIRSDEVQARADLPVAADEVGVVADALFVVRAPSLATVVALATTGERMPAKTTSFRPKPRTGLVLRPLDPVPGTLRR